MEYNGKYKLFDSRKIITYPLLERINKVKLEDLIKVESTKSSLYDIDDSTAVNIDNIALDIVNAYTLNKPVIVFSGAHLVKNGLGPLLVDLIDRKLITLFAGNAASAIHDFELALIGETSEYVPEALEKGQFGMAYEFAYIHVALKYGNLLKLGYGESLGKMICDPAFSEKVINEVSRCDSPKEFKHQEVSILAACYRNNIPYTIHAGIGTDVIDQHPSFDGEAKGGCSGRDFLIYTNETTKLKNGGVILNIGSAVTGPEVLLKAISMAANIGSFPKGIITADFDLRNFYHEQMKDETSQNYYFRDQKSVVTRIPEAFGGKGYYIKGNQLNTVPFLYKMIIKHFNNKIM
jgi:hypothetical protein